MVSRLGTRGVWLVLATLVLGCAGGPDPIAFRNKTFYEYGLGREGLGRDAFEKPYPPLDIAERAYIGVQVLEGIVRMSRPSDWVMRHASLEPEKRYIEYVSPNQLIFTIYERLESPSDPWSVLQGRYEKDLEAEGGTILEKAVPTATFNAQGREYVVERGVPAPKAPFINSSREFLVRGERRVLLVQVVHQGDNPVHAAEEILPVLRSLQVL